VYIDWKLCQNGAIMALMSPDAKSTEGLDRINLRLPKALFNAIDAARARRAGRVSRNTWIAEAVQEKLAREGAANDQPGGRIARGSVL
jgi:metal-responsive CopG/Arc/MetJ family transcriptional regulator